MKICILTHTFPRFSGDIAAPFMGEFAKALVKAGSEVTVLAPFDKGIDEKPKRNFHLVTYKYIFPKTLHILGYSRTLSRDSTMNLLSYLLSPFLYFFGFFSLLRLVKKEEIDLISAHWILPNGFIAACVSKITKVPFTITIPGSDIYMSSKNIFFRWMAIFAARNASYIISDNHHYLEQLRNLGYEPTKAKIIPYGVGPDKFKLGVSNKNLLLRLGIQNKDRVILCVGRMVTKKGFMYMVKAMPEILRKNNNMVKLVFVGDGEERRNLEIITKRLSLNKDILFVGSKPHDELLEYYSLADVFVMPSVKDERGNIDASPVAMFEAMICGLPIVATNFSSDRDLIIDGKNGYLVKDRDSHSIAISVSRIISKKLDNKMKLSIREFALTNLSSSVISRKYINIFSEVLKYNE